MPEYWREVAAFRGMATEVPAAVVLHGCTHGSRPCSSSVMIRLVISS